jgi:hypothetical protein
MLKYNFVKDETKYKKNYEAILNNYSSKDPLKFHFTELKLEPREIFFKK